MQKKLKYFMNGFFFQYDFFERNLGKDLDFDLRYPNVWRYTPGWKYIPWNFWMVQKMYRNQEIQKYDIVQFNNTENFLNFRKQEWQLSIAESHGFDFGVNYQWFVKDEKNPVKYIIWNIINILFWWKIRKKIQEFDIYYCSTPDMLEPLRKKVRADVKWLPNPINTEIFQPEWETIKLEWSPSFFFPTRVHGDKKPEIAIDIFRKYIKPNFPEATLHLLEWGYEVPKYKKLLSDKRTYFWHGFMDKETLAAKIRGSDYCFGDFSIGGLSLMPMQIMACKKPIVTYDMHEIIKIPREELWELTKKLLENEKYRNKSIQKNYDYIMKYHTEKAVCNIHLKNIRSMLKEKYKIEI